LDLASGGEMRSRVDPRVGCGGRYRSFPENAAWHPCLARMARRLRLMSLHMRHVTHVGEGRAKRRGARTGPREARPHTVRACSCKRQSERGMHPRKR
jgi:hypothetical protein